MEQSSGDKQAIFRLSAEEQRIQVVAQHHEIKWDIDACETSLGELLATETESIEAEVFILYRQLGKFACEAVITPPPQLLPDMTSVFSESMRALLADDIVDLIVDDTTALKTSTIPPYLIHLDKTTAEDTHTPEVTITAKSPDPIHWDSPDPDQLDVRIHDPNEVVLAVGKLVSAVANALHEQTDSTKTAQYTITLPEPAYVPRSHPHHYHRREPLPEHADFPTFEQLGGLDTVTQQLKQAAQDRFTNDETLKEYGLDPHAAILLYGPGGTGKTSIAKALARDMRLNFQEVLMSDIISKYIGEPEQKLHGVFEAANTASRRTLLLLDEFNGLFSSHAGGNEGAALTLINECKKLLEPNRFPRVLVVATANSLADIPEELLRRGRFDTTIHIGLPDARERGDIIAKFIYTRPQHFQLVSDESVPQDPIMPSQLGRLTEHMTGAELHGVLQDLLRNKMRHEREGTVSAAPISHLQVEAAIRTYIAAHPKPI